MIFLFKPKEVVIDAFTTNIATHKFFPIERAARFIPDWWKNIPKDATVKNSYVDEVPGKTMRHCAGFVDYFKHGYVLPMWSDVKIKTTENGFWWQFADENASATNHPSQQHNNSFQGHHHIKLFCPWHLKSKVDIPMLCSMPSWNMPSYLNKIHVLPGVVNPKEVSVLHVNCFLAKQENNFLIDAGTPIYHLAPLTDKKIKVVSHLVSEDELKKTVLQGLPFFEKSLIKARKFKNGDW